MPDGRSFYEKGLKADEIYDGTVCIFYFYDITALELST